MYNEHERGYCGTRLGVETSLKRPYSIFSNKSLLRLTIKSITSQYALVYIKSVTRYSLKKKIMTNNGSYFQGFEIIMLCLTILLVEILWLIFFNILFLTCQLYIILLPSENQSIYDMSKTY